MTPPITITLDPPPGINRTYKSVRTKTASRIIKSTAARDWANYAQWNVVAQRQGASMPYQFRCLIVLSDESNFDIDAGVKAILDACQAGGAIVNDKLCRGLCVEFDERPSGTVMVELTALAGEPPQKKTRKA